ncbi:MAG: ArsR/SmtB family transcription factor, partial [Alphaproteobacteria bacterium]
MLSVLRAAGEPNRLRILALCAGGDLTVRELTSVLGQSQPGVSRHLKLLCDARLLERYQEGSWAYFHLPTNGVPADIVRFLLDQVRHDDPTITRDLQRFENIKQE